MIERADFEVVEWNTNDNRVGGSVGLLSSFVLNAVGCDVPGVKSNMAYWLKLIGTTEKPIDPVEVRTEEFVDSSVGRDEWIDNGHKILLYATGHQFVYASADVISEPYDSGQPRWPARVDIRYRQQPRAVQEGVHVNQIKDVGHELLQELMHKSFIAISEEEFNRGEELLGNEF